MVPKVIPASERKQPVSISLTAVEIAMLNKLSEDTGKNRSRLVAGMIRASAQIKMGLSELEAHSSPVQKWKGACNPMHIKGRCTHPECVKVYKAAGV